MTSNTTISSCTCLPFSIAVPWAGERVNAVNPPKRSVKFCRTSAYFSDSNDWPLLSWGGRNISIRCIRSPLSEPQHSKHEKQRQCDRIGNKQRSETAEPVREEEKHGATVLIIGPNERAP